MSNTRKRTPKLRFPEFRKEPGWNQSTIGEVATILKGKGLSKADLEPQGKRSCIRYAELYTRYGEVIDDVYSRTNAPDDDLFLSDSNDVIIPASGETKADIATASCVLQAGVALGSDLNVLRSPHNGVFLSYYINGRLRPVIAKVAQGDTVVHLYPSQLRETVLAVPSPAEQQKIADCLSSLDELIAAEVRKLESLRAYKKGLMQQLFPRAGETTPRLRFPEFRNAGEWDARPLAEVGTNLDNRRIPIAEVLRTKGKIPYYGASGIVDYVKDFIFDEDLLCVSEDGANLVARTYPIAFSISGKTWVNNHAHVLRFDDSHTQKIVEDYLNSIDLRDFITGMAQPKLNRAMLDTIPIPLPPDNDERVTDSCAKNVKFLRSLILPVQRRIGPNEVFAAIG